RRHGCRPDPLGMLPPWFCPKSRRTITLTGRGGVAAAGWVATCGPSVGAREVLCHRRTAFPGRPARQTAWKGRPTTNRKKNLPTACPVYLRILDHLYSYEKIATICPLFPLTAMKGMKGQNEASGTPLLGKGHLRAERVFVMPHTIRT